MDVVCVCVSVRRTKTRPSTTGISEEDDGHLFSACDDAIRLFLSVEIHAFVAKSFLVWERLIVMRDRTL